MRGLAFNAIMLGGGLLGGALGILLVATGLLDQAADTGWQGGVFTLLGLVAGGSLGLWLDGRADG